MPTDCKVEYYMNLSEGQDVLDMDELEFYEDICHCRDCREMGMAPVMSGFDGEPTASDLRLAS